MSMQKPLLIAICCLLMSVACFSQQKSSSGTPAFRVRWGSSLGGSISAEMVKQQADSPLVVFDQKGKRYPVVSFSVYYKFNSSYKDEETGRTNTIRELRVGDFDGTDRFTQLWRESVRDNVKAEDEIRFRNILVRMPNGKKMAAPETVFTVR
jgi:hypothetical protein